MLLASTTLAYCGASSIPPGMSAGNWKIAIDQGDEWLHDFPLFWFIKTKNAPQIAIWAEDMDGRFLSTSYVSNKLAKQS